MTELKDRDIGLGRAGRYRDQSGADERAVAPAVDMGGWGITRISDADYLCVLRPCPAWEEKGDGTTD